jgi:hypothetical protein
MIRSIGWYHTFLAEVIGTFRKEKNVGSWSYNVYLVAVAELLNLQIFVHEGPSPIIAQIREIRDQLEILCSLPVPESTDLQRLFNEQTDYLLDIIAIKDSSVELMMNLDSEDGAL